MSYDGKLGDILRYRAMIDPSIIWNGPIVVTGPIPPGSNSFRSNPVTTRDILQDAWVGAALPYTEIKMGQFKIPLTMEGFGSSAKLDFAERASLSRIFGDQRDIGLMVSSDSKVPYVEYQVGVFNGRGKNVLATGPSKDVGGRIVGKPYKGISVGASGYLGRIWDTSSLSYRQKNRAGVEAAVEMYNATLKFEYMVGRELITTPQGPGKTSPTGYYITAGYRLPMYEFVQFVGRYDHWDSDANTNTTSCVAGAPLAGDSRCSKYESFTFGVNYDIIPEVLHGGKLQLDYYRDTDDVQNVSANEVFLVAQVKF
jgi:hypothetical protein